MQKRAAMKEIGNSIPKPDFFPRVDMNAFGENGLGVWTLVLTAPLGSFVGTSASSDWNGLFACI